MCADGSIQIAKTRMLYAMAKLPSLASLTQQSVYTMTNDCVCVHTMEHETYDTLPESWDPLNTSAS